ncbi:UNVERIFIED_CONTAM: Kinesin-like protein KIN-7E, chloroplastic [Sesamum angustifolium]|uniref:Kinesin-like protein KIN-7E, chloroplastic n=1 Tax=Sesamum angustifolium TaxID=2727405 RepID=A0AAW2LW62_9LAMI
MSSSSASRRSSISPFRSRKAPLPPPNISVRPATPSSSSTAASAKHPALPAAATPPGKAKENVTVTVRFRPLSAREISKGDEAAWYGDGDYTVRNEFNSDIAYGFDRVFGPATTTRHVYDIAAQHVVGGAMEGINGTVFAYGVTSSGKTHTMHGEQKSPGIIPLAVKDVFGIIQEVRPIAFDPGREYLLRVSYLEIYNEVINDLLDPTGQNLRIREDSQVIKSEGHIYVEGIKEEVVLSPAHALSLIASGEEHRHVGSNNFNLLSSRSHTIFTLTIESSLRGGNEGEEVTLSQLVISKLTDGKSTHIPYRDSKLTRLLQSSLSGHGRVSILDEKSLIKKYQREISNLKQELQQLKRGMMEKENLMAPSQEDLVNLKLQVGANNLYHSLLSVAEIVYSKFGLFLLYTGFGAKLEAGQIKLQSRLEEEEQAKAALMGRIQRLTKLILVSTKTTIQPNVLEKPSHRRRHSFGEDELAYLPDRKRECLIDDDDGSIDSEISVDGRSGATNLDELVRDYKRNRRRGMLGWFKLKKPENVVSPSADYESSTSGSPASSSKSSQRRVMFSDIKDAQRKSISRKVDNASPTDSFPERTQAGDLFSAAVGVRHLPPVEGWGQRFLCFILKGTSKQVRNVFMTGSTITDQMDLFREQIKMLAGEVALSTSSLKRLTEQAAKNPGDSKLQENIQILKDGIREKKASMRVLEQRMLGSVEISPYGSNVVEMSQQDKVRLIEEKDGLEIHCQKQTEEACYAKELAAAAAVELRNLAEEVTKLSYQNAKLTADLAAARDVRCKANCCQKSAAIDMKQNGVTGTRSDPRFRKPEDRLSMRS